MARKKTFDASIVSEDEARKELTGLRSRGSRWRTSKFDPLKSHIQWLERGNALRIDEMSRTDVANLRSYIDRNVEPAEKNMTYVVRSARIDDAGKNYRAYVLKEKEGKQ